jgi:hypothetical protein
MSDEELRKTAKGNTYVPDVWVTHHDTDWGPHLWSANIVPWDEDYDAPITGWADNTHFVNADRIVAAEARIEALERDAKAHEKEIAVWSENYAALDRKLEAARAGTKKAVEALQMADTALYEAEAILGGEYGDFYGPLCDQISKLRAIIAEIEGEKG